MKTPVLAAVLCLALSCATRADETEEHDAHAGFTIAEFESFGVCLATAGAGTVDLALELPGEVRPDGDRLAHLAPRFTGVVREVYKRAGDEVRAGQVLAVVESDNLSRFELKSSLDGIVVDRHVTTGEIAGPDRPAFIVADLSTVWIEVSVYQSALSRVVVGRPVHITSGRDGAGANGTISFLSPVVNQDTRTAMARVVMPNPDGAWRPGVFVSVAVDDAVEAAVVVPRRAVHRLNGGTVVFVVAGDHFETRPVRLGRVGATSAEVTVGLAPGERFADEGSFVVKAELGKSAEHEDH